MEILKEILIDPKNTNIEENSVIVRGKEYNGSESVELEKLPDKKYNLKQLAFFFKNKDIPYSKYLEMCKRNNIGTIFYTDQKLLVEEVQSFEKMTPLAFCDDPEKRYIGKRSYEWVSNLISNNLPLDKDIYLGKKYRVIVPSSPTSLLNLDNIVSFLENGEVIKSHYKVFDSFESSIMDYELIFEDDVQSWTSDSWSMLVAIFCDGTKWQLKDWKIGDIAGLFHSTPAFYICKNGDKNISLDIYNINKIFIDDDGFCKKEDFDSMWVKIKDSIQKRSIKTL